MRDSLVDQLANFDSRLEGKFDDVAMLSEIQEAIGRLLAENNGSEAQIRLVLQERYENGSLRKETFQLVKSMLDRYVTEHAPTSPELPDTRGRVEPSIRSSAASPDANEPATDPMRSTVVLPENPAPEAATADSRVQIGSVLRDRFLLQERVSDGGMGVVYKAIDRHLGEAASGSSLVAIKILSPALSNNELALRALQQEAAKGRCLVHPNIVRFIDLDREDDLHFIVMEWLEGRTLADILDSPDSRSIDTDRAFRIIRQVGKALEYAHRCGIVHADVKPGNIMIMPNGDAKLFDFGVARVRQQQLDKDPDFDPGILGLMTPAYSSMQVLTGEIPVPSDDVFSLACLLYRLVAGYRVFGPRNAAQAADEGMKPQRLDRLSDANWRVLKKALSYSRVTRFESMQDFLDALDVEAAESITVDIPAPGRFADAGKERRGPGRALFGLVVLAAVAGVVANQMGLLDSLKARYLPGQPGEVVEEPAVAEVVEPSDGAPAVGAEVPAAFQAAEEMSADGTDTEANPIDEQGLNIDDVLGEETIDSLEPEETIAVPEPEVISEPLVDFARLPPPTAEILLGQGGQEAESISVRLREDDRTATVDLVRSDATFPLTLRLEEIGFSGNRSPWVTNQYVFSDNGYLEFPAGQKRARVMLAMTSDDIREPDQQVTIRVRESESTTSQLAIINVLLEDDDQRRFEATLPPDTVAFGASQVTVNEENPAVQLDVLRFNPSSARLVVAFELRDITATQGEDYFAPGNSIIEFGPGQRVTRLLIPLVQDSDYESNEAFSVELTGPASSADVYRRVAVLIRDDDQ
ncbi:MAG: protein kinase [Woeseiaceae bacterium]|nr:protein kinase [Woeseiaceae bacterium]